MKGGAHNEYRVELIGGWSWVLEEGVGSGGGREVGIYRRDVIVHVGMGGVMEARKAGRGCSFRFLG